MQSFPFPSANILQASVVAVHLEQNLQWLWKEGSVSQSCLTAYAKQNSAVPPGGQVCQPQELNSWQTQKYLFLRQSFARVDQGTFYSPFLLESQINSGKKFSLLHCVPEDFPPTRSDWQVPEALVNALNGPPSNTIQTDFLWLNMLYFLTTGIEFSFSSKILNKAFALLQIFF